MATCTQCGAELKPGTKFCENCGAKVSVPQPAAQPEAVPQPPVQPTQAAPQPPQPAQTPPQPQAGGGNPYAGGAPAAPQPQTNAANPYAGNAPGTPPQTGAGAPLYARNTPPACVHTAGCSPCCHAAATRRHGRQPLRQCGPRRQAQAPPRTNDPQTDDPDRHSGDIPAYDHRNNDQRLHPHRQAERQ